MVIIDKINFIDGVTELSADNFNQMQTNSENALTDLEILVKAYAENYVKNQRRGNVFHHAGTAAPTGSLICNGSAISRTTYASLFAVIGTTYGVGDGSTTFNLPNEVTGNRFRRAAGGSLSVGTIQEDELESHTHTLTGDFQAGNAVNDDGNYSNLAAGDGGTPLARDFTSNNYIDSYGGDETRPKNIAYLPCIWY